MTDEEQTTPLEDKLALLRPDQRHETLCKWSGLSAWASCTMAVVIVGLTLVQPLVPVVGIARPCLGLSPVAGQGGSVL